MNQIFDMKKELWRAAKGILYILAIVFFFRLFNVSFWGRYIVLCMLVLLFSIINSIRKRIPFSVKSTLVAWSLLLGIFLLMRWLAAYGFIISALVLSSIILWRRRKRFIETKQKIEAMIWGKPLKYYRDNGKKPPKLKITF